MVELKYKTFDRYESKSKIYDGKEAIDRYNHKILWLKRDLKINKILDDL